MGVRLFLLFITLVCGVSFAQKPAQESFVAWLCRVLRLDPATYRKMVAARRAVPDHFVGDKVAFVDLRTRKETVLYDCGGCWSPASLGDGRIAVLKSDGVWVAAPGAKPKLAIRAENLRAVLGPIGGNPASFLVVEHRDRAPSCEFAFKVADLEKGALDDPDEPRCLDLQDLAGLPRTQTIWKHEFLCPTAPGAGTRKILISDAPCGDDEARSVKYLLGWIEEEGGDGIERFDAVWIDRNRVLYLQK